MFLNIHMNATSTLFIKYHVNIPRQWKNYVWQLQQAVVVASSWYDYYEKFIERIHSNSILWLTAVLLVFKMFWTILLGGKKIECSLEISENLFIMLCKQVEY